MIERKPLPITSAPTTGRLKDACAKYGVGKDTMRKLAAEAKAGIKVGRLYLVNFQIMDEYMRKLAG